MYLIFYSYVLQEMYYPDGHSPPPEIIERWLTVLADTFDTKGPEDTPCIAIHCVAGLGRLVLSIVCLSVCFDHFILFWGVSLCVS